MRDVIFVEGISEYQFQRKIWKTVLLDFLKSAKKSIPERKTILLQYLHFSGENYTLHLKEFVIEKLKFEGNE